MRVNVDSADFVEQRRLYQLRFCCDDCAFFVPDGRQCAHGWPTEEHRQSFYDGGERSVVVYCKEFELR